MLVFLNMMGKRYQNNFKKKHKPLTTNFAVFVDISARLQLIFINYGKPPDYHVTYTLRDKLHISCKNNDETFLYGI